MLRHILPPKLATKIRKVFEAAEGIQGKAAAEDQVCCTPMYGEQDEEADEAKGGFGAHKPFKLAYHPHDTDQLSSVLAESGLRTIWVLPYAHKGDGMAQQLNEDVARICQAGFDPTSPLQAVPALTVHPADGDDGVRATTIHALVSVGCRAAKLHCSVGRYGVLHPNLDPFWQIADLVRLPVVVHFGQHISGHTAVAELDDVELLVLRYKHVPLVIAHSAAPSTQKAIRLASCHANVYLDTTPVGEYDAALLAVQPLLIWCSPLPVTHCVAFPPRTHPQHAVLLSLANQGRVLFGSDFPNVAVKLEEQIQHVFRTFAKPQWSAPSDRQEWWKERAHAQEAGQAVTEVLGDAAQRLLRAVDERQINQLRQRL